MGTLFLNSFWDGRLGQICRLPKFHFRRQLHYDNDGRGHLRTRQTPFARTVVAAGKSHVRVTIESDVEREAWLKLSEENLLKTWSNPDDDVFNELLAK
jgi:hypothetical protein